MSGYRDQKKCDNCGQWLDPLEKCGCLSTTPPPAPAGERLDPARSYGITLFDHNDQLSIYSNVADRNDPRHELSINLRDAVACLLSRASSPAPTLELTSQERASVEAARRFLAQHPFPFSDERELWNMLAILDRCFPRLTTPADGEGGR